MPLFTNRPRHLNDDSQNAPRSLFSKLRQWLYFRRGGDPTASWNSEDFFPRRDISHTSLRTRKSSCRLTTTRNRDEVPTDGVPYYSYPQNLAAVPNGRGVHRDQRHYTPPDNRHLYQFDALSRKPDNPYPYQYTAPASMLPSVPPSQEGQSGTPHRIPEYIQQMAYPVFGSHLPDTHSSRRKVNAEHRIQRETTRNTRHSPPRRPPPSPTHNIQPRRNQDERQRPIPQTAQRTPSNLRSGPPPPRDLRGTLYTLLPELIPAVFRYPSVDWMICFPLSSAFKWAGPEQKEALNLGTVAIIPPIKGAEGVCIFTRKDNTSLSLVLQRYGPIRLASDEIVTTGSILRAIEAYFNTPLSTVEMDALDPAVRKHVTRSFRQRWDAQGQTIKKQVWPMLSHDGPTRVDFLFNYFRYAGLEIDKNFAENKKLYLTLQNSWLPQR